MLVRPGTAQCVSALLVEVAVHSLLALALALRLGPGFGLSLGLGPLGDQSPCPSLCPCPALALRLGPLGEQSLCGAAHANKAGTELQHLLPHQVVFAHALGMERDIGNNLGVLELQAELVLLVDQLLLVLASVLDLILGFISYFGVRSYFRSYFGLDLILNLILGLDLISDLILGLDLILNLILGLAV